ncbi:MAG: sigma-54-dependent Fis family transcriptional regulator [Deltaproteobacteria bacterium]|nr:sigma-54-dependent Fis family transcriptional regulator [Deltaproteobacteria bacterium]
MKICIVDDEPIALSSLARLLRRRGYRDVDLYEQSTEAVERIKTVDYDVVLLDLLMPEKDGLDVLAETKPCCPGTEFIMLTAVDDVNSAVKALRLGACDYLLKPVDNDHLLLVIERALEHRALMSGRGGSAGQDIAEISEAFQSVVTCDPRMRELLAYAEVMARGGNSLLLSGESGTGKELVARGVHRAGPHPDGAFVAVNVASIPEQLFESQFFGHSKGAFTGAERDYVGYFEQANGGTLFLDEIGELPLNQQVKFLRVLEEKSFSRLGDNRPLQVEFRLVSASNRDLDRACSEGGFRLDLLYRLRAALVHLPPLRERSGDIDLLAAHFCKKACAQYQKQIEGFSREAIELLRRRSFPGNVRELAQLVANAVLLCDADMITPDHLGARRDDVDVFAPAVCSLKENSDKHIVYVLKQTGGDRREAAEVLGITLRQLQRRVAELKGDPRWSSFLE